MMAWYSSERGSLDDSPREPTTDVSLTSQERAVIAKFVSDELSAYQSGELEPTTWREVVLRELWRKLHDGHKWV